MSPQASRMPFEAFSFTYSPLSFSPITEIARPLSSRTSCTAGVL